MFSESSKGPLWQRVSARIFRNTDNATTTTTTEEAQHVNKVGATSTMVSPMNAAVHDSPETCVYYCPVHATISSGYRCTISEVDICRLKNCEFCEVIFEGLSSLDLENSGFSLAWDGLGCTLRICIVQEDEPDWYHRTAHPLRLPPISERYEFYQLEIPYDVKTAPGNPLPWIGIRSEIAQGCDRSASLARAGTWLQTCTEDHTTCFPLDATQGNVLSTEKQTGSLLPKRIINVSDTDTPRLLCDFQFTATVKTPYVTLSHCWGSHPTYKTTRLSLLDRMSGMPWDDIPATFQDAITVTRALGIEYLWIDSLCIVQDDPNDWAEEASNMAHIYANATLTIAASAAKDDTVGFLKMGSYDQMINTVHNIPSRPFIKLRRDIHRDGSEPGPLLGRAWVYQERLLSRRVLYFERFEMVWECREAHICECGSDLKGASYRQCRQTARTEFTALEQYADASLATTYSFTRPSMSDSETYAWWRMTIVQTYSNLRLSRESDRLPALSGLAAIARMKTKDFYLAGLWRMDIARGLLWKADRQPYFDREYHGPSWSWVSNMSPILYDWFPLQREFVTVIDHNITCATVDPTGAVLSATLRLKCPILLVNVPYHRRHSCDRIVIYRQVLEDTKMGKLAIHVKMDGAIVTVVVNLRGWWGRELHTAARRKLTDITESDLGDQERDTANVFLAVVGWRVKELGPQNCRLELAGIVLAPSQQQKDTCQRVGHWTAFQTGDSTLGLTEAMEDALERLPGLVNVI
ncbi:HET-domain-containing protein [Byssothecium circinans]|uniref:HET-domain-containing protein n=1 Tax=Byssothecium circinans TaxID=147558 RepID=A0A6A5TGE4_9PLEO|nr:HET-domain-containing protein [Byssothecium circinans]